MSRTTFLTTAAAILILAQADDARARGIIFINTGETIKHVGDLPDKTKQILQLAGESPHGGRLQAQPLRHLLARHLDLGRRVLSLQGQDVLGSSGGQRAGGGGQDARQEFS